MKPRYLISYVIIILFTIMRFINIAKLSPTMPLRLQLLLAGWYVLWYAVMCHSTFILGYFLDKRLPLDKKLILRILVQVSISLVVLESLQFWVITPFLAKVAQGYVIIRTWVTIMISSAVFVLMFNGIYLSTFFWERWTKLLLETERMEKEQAIQNRDIAEKQFTQLKNKLNPHFLFNSLAVATDLVYQSPEDTQKFLVQMSKAYRYIVQNYDQPLVALSVELKFIEDYLALLHTRFQKGFSSEIVCNTPIENKWIVPLTLQILVENAIKHNTVSERYPMCLKIMIEDEFLWVENTLKKKKTVSSTGVGLNNLRAQYGYYTTDQIACTETEQHFKVQVPLLNYHANMPATLT
jgi:sensor histidine kinase YesM